MRYLWILLFALTALAPTAGHAAPPTKAKALPPVVKRAVNAIMAGDPKPLKNDLTAQMAALLTREVLQATKKQYIEPLGAFVSAKVVTTQKAQGYAVTIFQMHLQKGDMTGQMSLDAKGKVAGLFVRPATQ